MSCGVEEMEGVEKKDGRRGEGERKDGRPKEENN